MRIGSGRERRNKWGPTQSCRERHSGQTLTTDASLARLASPRSFSLPPSPFALLTTISSSPSSNSRVARRTISLTLSVARIRVWPLYLPAEGAIPCSVVSVFAASCTRPCIAFVSFFFFNYTFVCLSLLLSILSLFLRFVFLFLLSITFPWNLFLPLKSTCKILSFYYVSRRCDSYLSCRNSERSSRKCALETAFGGRVILHGDYQ